MTGPQSWGVIVHGDERSIERLRELVDVSKGLLSFAPHEAGGVLSHPAMVGEAQRAADFAKDMVARLSGLLTSRYGDIQGLTTGPLVNEQGTHVIVGTAHITLPGFGVSPETINTATVTLALNDPLVGETLRYMDAASTSDEVAWTALYKAFSIIEDDTGGDYTRLGAITKKQAELFTHTANTFNTATRDAARHGTGRKPPSNPMTLSNARRGIRRLVDAWIEWRQRRHTS